MNDLPSRPAEPRRRATERRGPAHDSPTRPSAALAVASNPLGRAAATARVVARARQLGFDAVGIARADVPLDRDIERYDAFVAEGMYGEMAYLARHRDARVRLDGDAILPGARSVVCVARRYPASAKATPEGSGLAPHIAAYARGRDYHRFARRGLRRLAKLLRSFGSADAPVRARPLCDEEPILERAWAARAGLGFVGKNGLLIVPGVGSLVLLGEVVTTLELETGTPMREHCGACTRCLDACPTGAFAAPFVLDPRRCIAYLTIEHKSATPVELREAVGEHLFGCDECQTACPFNAGARARDRHANDEGPFAPLERWSRLALEDLMTVAAEGWTAIAGGSPLWRAGRSGLARNAAIVLGNRADRRALPALQHAAATHDDERVRDAAAWAVTRLTAFDP